jgi:hypothetical protein
MFSPVLLNLVMNHMSRLGTIENRAEGRIVMK